MKGFVHEGSLDDMIKDIKSENALDCSEVKELEQIRKETLEKIREKKLEAQREKVASRRNPK